jgi:hypothetical protein
MIEDPFTIIKKADQLQDIPDKWTAQYARSTTPWHREVSQNLQALKPEERTQERMDQIIGNGSWTALRCQVCGKDVDVLMQLGEEPDYDSTGINICKQDLQKALRAFRESK